VMGVWAWARRGRREDVRRRVVRDCILVVVLGMKERVI